MPPARAAHSPLLGRGTLPDERASPSGATVASSERVMRAADRSSSSVRASTPPNRSTPWPDASAAWLVRARSSDCANSLVHVIATLSRTWAASRRAPPASSTRTPTAVAVWPADGGGHSPAHSGDCHRGWPSATNRQIHTSPSASRPCSLPPWISKPPSNSAAPACSRRADGHVASASVGRSPASLPLLGGVKTCSQRKARGGPTGSAARSRLVSVTFSVASSTSANVSSR
mmetsp:Transcript_18878/g.48666  ORF Transcript_18878/g.48666 Transcript_18878/m.48666 type:complete len:231 (-) Transcript_18878:49-741(-)